MGVLSGEQPGNREDSGRNWEGPPTEGHPLHEGKDISRWHGFSGGLPSTCLVLHLVPSSGEVTGAGPSSLLGAPCGQTVLGRSG